MDIVCRWAGSVHDSRIFYNSTIQSRLDSNEMRGVLLADSGYTCKRYILTPVLTPKSNKERLFNAAHIRASITMKMNSIFSCQ